ncbi:sigma factor, partial [Streptomyces omiyaensis]|uniref:sigma factor n=1 Tax=Streptomyces omiyaensis TaxID=68247 RepID=UPI00227D7E09
MNRPVPVDGPGPPPSPVLADVMREVGQGDQQAFSTLYDALAPMVFGLVVRVLRDRAQSEEVTQEVMIDLWRQAARYRPEAGSVRTWAATVAHRRAV